MISVLLVEYRHSTASIGIYSVAVVLTVELHELAVVCVCNLRCPVCVELDCPYTAFCRQSSVKVHAVIGARHVEVTAKSVLDAVTTVNSLNDKYVVIGCVDYAISMPI